MKKQKDINRVLVCGRCNVEPVKHEVTERQMYKMKKGKNGLETSEFELKNGKRIPLARVVTTGKHCPKCFNQSNFKLVLEDQVVVYKKKDAHTHS